MSTDTILAKLQGKSRTTRRALDKAVMRVSSWPWLPEGHMRGWTLTGPTWRTRSFWREHRRTLSGGLWCHGFMLISFPAQPDTFFHIGLISSVAKQEYRASSNAS